MSKFIDFSVECEDITEIKADVSIFKYAQTFLGVDFTVGRLLKLDYDKSSQSKPGLFECNLVDSKGILGTPLSLFYGMPKTSDIEYNDLRNFTKNIMAFLESVDGVKHIVTTIHGPGFGLDEKESLLSLFDGFLDALRNRSFPLSLEKITIVDRKLEKVERFRQYLDSIFSEEYFGRPGFGNGSYQIDKEFFQHNKRQKDYPSNSNLKRFSDDEKSVVFVSMPFKKEMDDVFYYGIQQPIHKADMICERIDKNSFVGDILDEIKKKIKKSKLMIADLTTSNPNVFLEIGYAWGINCPTILLVNSNEKLPFNVQSQRCIMYNSIKNLEKLLSTELEYFAK